MARRRARNEEGEFLADNPETPEVDEAWVEDSKPEQKLEPVVSELISPKEEPTEAPAPAPKSEIETDVRQKLRKKTDEADQIFVPTSPAVLEAEAKKVAEEKGFDLNRGTSIGARLIARSRMK